MNRRFVCLATAALVASTLLAAGCGAGGATPAPASDPPVSVASAPPAATPTAAPTPEPTPASTQVAADIEYESAEPLLVARALDVYAPTAPGPWPVVVMFHGGPGVLNKDFLAGWAQDVAAEGYVVFVPSWGLGSLEAQKVPRSTWLAAIGRQAACSVAYARSHAAEYGGDPSTLVLFGHSAGANTASVLAFNRPTPSDGCPGGAELGPISSVVTFEGDWLFMDSMWDQVIPDDPATLSEGTPWDGLADHTDLPVVMLVSEGSGGVTDPPTGDPPVDLATARDPVALRAALKTALTDGQGGDIAQEQAVLHAALKAQGNPVSLTEIPGADHNTLGLSGRPALLAAIDEAASRGGPAAGRIESLSPDADGTGPTAYHDVLPKLDPRLVPVGPDEAWARDARGVWHYLAGRWSGPYVPEGGSGVIGPLAVAPDGTVWLGMADGVAVLRDGSWKPRVLPASRQLAMATDGTVWSVTTAGTVQHYDPRTGVESWVTGCRDPFVLEPGPDGTMYVGTFGYLTGRVYSVRDFRCEPLDPLGDGRSYYVGDIDADANGRVLAVLITDPNAGGTQQPDWTSYVALLAEGRWSVLATDVRRPKDPGFLSPWDEVAFAPDGSIWRARMKEDGDGIERWGGAAWETVIPDVAVLSSMSFGPDGSLWFVGESGLFRIRPEGLRGS